MLETKQGARQFPQHAWSGKILWRTQLMFSSLWDYSGQEMHEQYIPHRFKGKKGGGLCHARARGVSPPL